MKTNTDKEKCTVDDVFDDIPPAPWKVNSMDERNNRAFILTDNREYPKSYCVAEVHAKYLGQLPKIANLIAAAPEMYEALKELLAMRHKCFIPNDGDWWDNKANSAIAKAEGRQ